MASHSVDDILAQLEKGAFTHGWGAVAAFSRERLNAMLAQQFTAAFSAATFLPPLSGEMPLDEDGHITLRFDNLIFGAPRLSFESSTFSTNRATFTIPLIGGDVTRIRRSPLLPDRLLATARITEGMDYVLQMEVKLRETGSSVEDAGHISISPFNEPRDPRCNLMTPGFAQTRIGQFLLEHLLDLPLQRSTYTLGLLNAGTHGPLSPTDFTVLTYAAPGAERTGAANHGDGAVLIFMKLKGWDNHEVQLPSDEASFPYLIPDDVRDGRPLYSAAILITHRLSHFVDDTQLAALSSSLLPRGYAFVEGENARHTPYDVVAFGNLDTTDELVTIEPLVISLRDGASQQFTARDGSGAVVQAAGWSSESIEKPLASGSISAGGLYRTVDEPIMGSNVLPTVVTAHYIKDGQQRQTSALVMARFESLNVSPLACTTYPGAEEPIELAASSVSGGTLRWRLLAPALGTLTDLGNGHAVYQQPADMEEELLVQRIEVLDESTNEAVEAVVVLYKKAGLALDPPWTGALTGRGQHEFQVPQSTLDDLARQHRSSIEQDAFTWRLHGDGEISAVEGRAVYTPPATLSRQPVAVVECELAIAGMTLVGFSVIELTTRLREHPTWQSLQDFRLEPMQGTQAFANGMQQIPVRVTIETAGVNIDGVIHYIPISLVEEATLRLVDRISGQDVPYVDSDAEGIEHDTGLVWATSDARNRFRPYASATLTRTPGRRGNEEATRRKELFIHLANPVTPEFFARFTDKKDYIWDSLGRSEEDTISVQGMAVPTPVLEDYTFEYTRVWNGEGDIVEDDAFSYMLESVDFWRLSYRRMGVAIGFSSLKIEGNTSTLQYESELLDETFASFTGFAFVPIVHGGNRPTEPAGLSFDPYLTGLFNSVAHAPPDGNFWQQPPSPGELLVSNHRAADLPYWYDGMSQGDALRNYRSILDRPVRYVLRDEDGNRHSLQIGYADTSIPGSRNQLILVRTQKT